MKVLHVYSGNLYGGIERLLSTIARYDTQNARIDNHFALCFRGRLWDELLQTGATPYELGVVRLRFPWSLIRARNRLKRLLHEKRFDVVITHACWPHVVFAPAVRQLKTPLVNWVHDFLHKDHLLEKLSRTTLPDRLIVNSKFTSQPAETVFPGVRQSLLYYPIEPSPSITKSDRDIFRESLGVQSSQKVVLQVSRMEAWKGHVVLFEAVAKLRSNPGWTLWIVGGCQRPEEVAYQASLVALAAKLKITDRIHFLGQRKDVANIMASADLFCQSNLSPEPFGIVFVEALYARLPVISSNFGGAAEIVDQSCGVTVPPDDPSALAQSISKLLSDDQLRAQFSQSGPTRANLLCNPTTQLDKLADVLEEVAKQR